MKKVYCDECYFYDNNDNKCTKVIYKAKLIKSTDKPYIKNKKYSYEPIDVNCEEYNMNNECEHYSSRLLHIVHEWKTTLIFISLVIVFLYGFFGLLWQFLKIFL